MLNRNSTVENVSIRFVSSGAFSVSPVPFHESANLRKIQKVAVATHIMASAISHEYMLLLINNQWADAHLKTILCVVHFVTQADISCNWSGKIYVTTPILRPLSMSRDRYI